MPANKKISDLTEYTSVLPYSSEMFGVYQPLLGWKSKRIQKRLRTPAKRHENPFLESMLKYFDGIIKLEFNADCFATLERAEPGAFAGPRLMLQSYMVLTEVAGKTGNKTIDTIEEWSNLITYDLLKKILHDVVFPKYRSEAVDFCRQLSTLQPNANESAESFQKRKDRLIQNNQISIRKAMDQESAVAGLLLSLLEANRPDMLNMIFYSNLGINFKELFYNAIANPEEVYKDPFLSFDPKTDIKNVSLSPLGIVHLFRQFFFEFDTFLGTPTGHVWLAPGSTVELIEISTRKTIVEKTYESSYETITKAEKSETLQDEISEAVKKDNKDDLKLGITTTVNQSWGTGNASATTSLNMDKTQQVARENTHKKMREQSQKLSSEIRENYKSTFKTITETTDTSSKRYVLTNDTGKLINYELRRKMRQVGVQVQDIGSYLCWQTFVDEPGEQLGLANMVHIAKPADLIPVPAVNLTPPPPDQPVSFTTNAVWDFGENRKYGFVLLTTYQVPPPPDGYELRKADYTDEHIDIRYMSHSGKDSQNQIYAFRGKFIDNWQQIEVGVVTGPGGLAFNKRIDFVVGGVLTYVPTDATLTAIKEANDKKADAAAQIESENIKKQNQEYLNSAKERIELANNVTKRKFEDLREEERIIVYRNLIEDLMTSAQYTGISDQSRHVMSELINSVFDVDKMLYFVAPEWWKPRRKSGQFIGANQFQQINSNTVVNWSDNVHRPDNYFITDKSKPAPMGSSLGWLIQLDGDDHRNAFLNAPWVKAVIPIRPGKEIAAINWLQNANVEGTDGLDANYSAPQAELEEIKAKLLAADPDDPVGTRPNVTIGDTIRFLCTQVSQKHEQSNKPEIYPKGAEIHDDDKVSATPIDKVYEYGFYPLKGGFRYDPKNTDPLEGDNTNFHVFDQWIEILPTDQVVPVPVEYNPKTGRQV
jgi:hypothetical protein